MLSLLVYLCSALLFDNSIVSKNLIILVQTTHFMIKVEKEYIFLTLEDVFFNFRIQHCTTLYKINVTFLLLGLHWQNVNIQVDNVCIHPGVNFTNVLQAAFMCADPKSALKLLNLTVFFSLLGSSRVKAACRTLVKLTPGWH